MNNNKYAGLVCRENVKKALSFVSSSTGLVSQQGIWLVKFIAVRNISKCDLTLIFLFYFFFKFDGHWHNKAVIYYLSGLKTSESLGSD